MFVVIDQSEWTVHNRYVQCTEFYHPTGNQNAVSGVSGKSPQNNVAKRCGSLIPFLEVIIAYNKTSKSFAIKIRFIRYFSNR